MNGLSTDLSNIRNSDIRTIDGSTQKNCYSLFLSQSENCLKLSFTQVFSNLFFFSQNFESIFFSGNLRNDFKLLFFFESK